MRALITIAGLLFCPSAVSDSPPPSEALKSALSESTYVAKAFAPGHYLAPANSRDTLGSVTSPFWKYFDDTSDAFVGVWNDISWSSMEAAEGVYSFSEIENWIAILKRFKPDGKLIVKINTRGFSYKDTDGDGIKDPPVPIVPSYISNDPTKYANGGYHTCSKAPAEVMKSDLNFFDSDVTDRYIALVTAMGQHFANEPALVMIQTGESALQSCHFNAPVQAAASGLTEKQMRISTFNESVRAVNAIGYNLRNAPVVPAYSLSFLGWVTDHIPDAYQTMCEAIFRSRSGGGGPNVKHGERQPATDYCYYESSNGSEASRFVLGMRGDGEDNCGWGNAQQVWAKKIGHVVTPPDTSSFNAQYPIWRRVTDTNRNYTCKDVDKGRYHIGEIVAAIRNLPTGWPAVEILRPINLQEDFKPNYGSVGVLVKQQ